MKTIVQTLKEKYGENIFILKLQDQYYNMGEKIEPVKEIVDIAHQAMENLDIDHHCRTHSRRYRWFPAFIYGSTNTKYLYGGENFHGKYEFISVDNMVKPPNYC